MIRIDDCEVVIRRDRDSFMAVVPQIGLFARAGTAAEALEALEDKKTRWAADILKGEAVDALQPPPPVPESSKKSIEILGLFAAKVAIVLILTAATLLVSGAVVANKIQGAIVSSLGSETVGGSNFWAKVEKELDRAADPSQDIPEQKKLKLLADLRIIVKRWRPFVAEIEPLFGGDPNAGLGPSGSPDVRK
jgi:hypothetical protein